jgi:dsRNA-specific ribonuclease
MLGINTLINIMSRFGNKSEKQSSIMHNERLEFLGDAVIEFITSIHLFHLFPEIEEGGLATYRAAIVQNQHLTVLAQVCHSYSTLAVSLDNTSQNRYKLSTCTCRNWSCIITCYLRTDRICVMIWSYDTRWPTVLKPCWGRCT